MIRLLVRIIGSNAESGRESTLAHVEADRFDPEFLGDQIAIALDHAIAYASGGDDEALRVWNPEVSISLTADNEEIRPSLHLTPALLLRLARAGAALDFDPYV